MAGDTPRARAAAAQALAHVEPAGRRRRAAPRRRGSRSVGAVFQRHEPRPSGGPRLAAAARNGSPRTTSAQHVRIAAIGAIGDIGVANDADAVPLLATFTEAADDRAGGCRRAGARVGRCAVGARSAAPRAVGAAAGSTRRGGRGDRAPRRPAGRRAAAVDSGGRRRSGRRAGGHRRLSRIGRQRHRRTRGPAMAAIAAVAGDPIAPRRRHRRAGAAVRTRRSRASATRSRRAKPPCAARSSRRWDGWPIPTASAYVVAALDDGDASVRQLAVADPVAARHARRARDRLPSSRRPIRRTACAAPQQLALRRLGKEQGVAADPPDAR